MRYEVWLKDESGKFIKKTVSAKDRNAASKKAVKESSWFVKSKLKVISVVEVG